MTPLTRCVAVPDFRQTGPPPTPLFLQVFIPGDFKSNNFARVDFKGLAGAFFVRVHSKGLVGSRGWKSGPGTPVEVPVIRPGSRDAAGASGMPGRRHCGTTGLPKPELEARGWKFLGGANMGDPSAALTAGLSTRRRRASPALAGKTGPAITGTWEISNSGQSWRGFLRRRRNGAT